MIKAQKRVKKTLKQHKTNSKTSIIDQFPFHQIPKSIYSNLERPKFSNAFSINFYCVLRIILNRVKVSVLRCIPSKE